MLLVAVTAARGTSARADAYTPFFDVCAKSDCKDTSAAFKFDQKQAEQKIDGGVGTYEDVARLYIKNYDDRIAAVRKEMYQIGGWAPDDYIKLNGCMAPLAAKGYEEFQKTLKCLDKLSFSKSAVTDTYDNSEQKQKLKHLVADLRECYLSIGAVHKNNLVNQADMKRLFEEWDSRLRELGKHLSYTDSKALKKAQLNETTETPPPAIWPQLAAASKKSPLPAKPSASSAATPVPAKPKPPAAAAFGSCYNPAAKDAVLTDQTIAYCVSGAQGKSCQANLGKSHDQVCKLISNLKLENFQHEVVAALAKPTVKTYIDLLRLKSITRLLQAHRILTGGDFVGVPKGCERFADGIKAFQGSPIPPSVKNASNPPPGLQEKAQELSQAVLWVTSLEQSDGPWCVSGGGVKAYPVRVEVEDKVDGGLQKVNEGSGACQRFWAHDVVDSYKAKISQILEDYPVLRAEHAMTDGMFDHYPKAKAIAEAGSADEVKSLYDAAKNQVSTSMQGTITAFCQDSNPKCDPDAMIPTNDPCRNTDPIESKQLKETIPPVPGAFLIGNEELNRDVLKELPPEFSEFQKCAKDLYKFDEKLNSYLTAGAGATCAVSAFTPAGPVLGPICAVGFLGSSLNNWNSERLHAEFVNQCRNASNAACSSKEEYEAYERYDAAISELKMSSAFAALEGASLAVKGPALVKRLRGLSTDKAGYEGITKEVQEISKLKDPAEIEKRITALDKKVADLETPKVAGATSSSDPNVYVVNHPGEPTPVTVVVKPGGSAPIVSGAPAIAAGKSATEGSGFFQGIKRDIQTLRGAVSEPLVPVIPSSAISEVGAPASGKVVFDMNAGTINLKGATVDPSHLKIGETITDSSGRKWLVKDYNTYSNTVTFADTFGSPVTVPVQPLESPAHTYKLSIKMPDGGAHEITVQIPALPDGSPDQAALARIKKGLTGMPAKNLDSMKLIKVNSQNNIQDLHWQKTYKSFTSSAATGGDATMNVYPGGMGNDLPGIAKHELGHLVSEKLYGSTIPPAAWDAAAAKDGGRYVSQYAMNAPAEDFAETFMKYVETDGGKLSPLTRANFKGRFEYLDSVFGAQPKLRAQVLAEAQASLAKKGLIISAGIGGGIYVTYEGVTQFYP